MQKVDFSSADRIVNITGRIRCKKLIRQIFKSESIKLNNIRFIFCSDEHLIQINKFYLNHNYFTDVITFVLSEKTQPIICEVYLSTDRIKENAKTYSVLYQNELLRVIIHACLHSCGYDDKNQLLKKQMHKKENYFLKLYSTFSRET